MSRTGRVAGAAVLVPLLVTAFSGVFRGRWPGFWLAGIAEASVSLAAVWVGSRLARRDTGTAVALGMIPTYGLISIAFIVHRLATGKGIVAAPIFVAGIVLVSVGFGFWLAKRFPAVKISDTVRP